jgi:MtN3 and saliva related transmembrane protein
LVDSIGFIAAILTTASFAPQVIRTWRSRRQGMSSGTLLMFGSGVTLWLSYGVLTNSAPVIAANAPTAAQVVAIAILGRRQ